MRDWDDLIRPGDGYEVTDFQNAAYQLMSQQILYEARNRQAPAYRLIVRHMAAFKDAFDLFGVAIHFDQPNRFVAAIPTLDKQSRLKTVDALLLLVLRKAFHEEAMRGALSKGSAVITIEALKDIHRRETAGRELPTDQGALRDMLGRMKAFGVVRFAAPEPGSTQPFDVEILPGILALVNEGSLARIAEIAGKAKTESDFEAE